MLDVIRGRRIAEALCAIVLVNGLWVGRGERATRVLSDGEVLAIWPPVAGGSPAFTRILEMSLSREEFFRLLPAAVPVFEVSGERVAWSESGRPGSIALIPMPARRLGSAFVSRHRVEITLEERSPGEGDAFMARFHRAFLRGGG